jgi:dTDP-4-amino-4,6-dideoxygalactose transaminase
MIPFNRNIMTDRERQAVEDVMASGHLCGGPLTKLAEETIERLLGARKVVLTSSCTRALEMAATLLELKPGDEIIMPSFTFVGTATAFLQHGGRPVYADIASETLSIEVDTIEPLVSTRTKAVVPVHYNGVARGLRDLRAFCDARGLYLVEDAAHGFLAEESGRPLGTFGHFGAFSFHDTKTFTCGEGGALVINDPAFIASSEIFADKGTNRASFSRGERAFYSWVGPGSTVAPGEIPAAILLVQIARRAEIIERQRRLFDRYMQLLGPLVKDGLITVPGVPEGCNITYGMFILLVNTAAERKPLLEHLRRAGVEATFHYVPLHQSEYGARFARELPLPVTESIAERLVRLPMSHIVCESDQVHIAEQIHSFYGTARRSARPLP